MNLTRRRSFRDIAWLFCLSGLRCGGDQGSTGPVPVATVTVSPGVAILNQFDSLQLTATPRDADGNPLSNRSVTWSTNAGIKASVTSTGLVHAFQGGAITVTAGSEGISGSAAITIVVPVAVVRLTPNALTMFEGDTFRLQVTLLGPAGDPPTDSTLTWGSSDSATATVVTGLVTAKKTGSVIVSALARDGEFGTATVMIQAAVASVTISPADTTVYATNFASFVTIVRDARGDTLTQWQESCPTSCKVGYPVELRSLDTSVARFVGCCTLLARRAGVDTIVSTSQDVSDTSLLRVTALTFTSVAVGNFQACALNVDSAAYCWAADSPYPAAGAQRFVDVNVGEFSACGLTPTRAPLCFVDTSATPLGAPPSDSIEVGASFLCGLTSTGVAWCAGGGASGQLGSGFDTIYSKQAVPVAGGLTFSSISAGGYSACGIATGGAAYCWGDNSGGMLGNGDSVSHSSIPVAVAGNHEFVQISAGYGHVCGVTNLGEGYCWGYNQYGQLGTGDATDSSSTPHLVAGGLSFTTISAGAQHSCGLTSTGAAYCWGVGGLLGTSGGASSNTPVPVDGSLTFLSIEAGMGNPSTGGTCGLTAVGAYCWGIGITGVNGVGQSLTPVKVDGQQ